MRCAAIGVACAAARAHAHALAAGAGCIGLAVLSLGLPSVPTTDSWGWIVWGREVTGLDLDTAVGGSPAWKPLPVLVTAPLSLAGDAAPVLWLVTARTGGLLALLFAYRLAARLGGRVAGVAAAICLFMTAGWLRALSHGYMEPVLAALVLAAAERHLARSRRAALALLFLASLVRPEAFLFSACYGVYLFRAEPEMRRYVLVLVTVAPVLWLGGEWWGAGDPLRGARAAQRTSDLNGLDVLSALGPRVGWPTLIVALSFLPVAIARREHVVSKIGAWAATWVALVALLAAVGGPSSSRFLVAPGALICVVAAVAIGRATAAVRTGTGRAAMGSACVLACLLAPLADGRANHMESQLRASKLRARIQRSLDAVARDVAPPPARCGPITLPDSLSWNRGAVAWTLDTSIDEIHTVPPSRRSPAVVFRRQGPRPRSLSLSVPPRQAGALYLVRISRAHVRVAGTGFDVRHIDHSNGWTVAEICPERITSRHIRRHASRPNPGA